MGRNEKHDAFSSYLEYFHRYHYGGIRVVYISLKWQTKYVLYWVSVVENMKSFGECPCGESPIFVKVMGTRPFYLFFRIMAPISENINWVLSTLMCKIHRPIAYQLEVCSSLLYALGLGATELALHAGYSAIFVYIFGYFLCHHSHNPLRLSDI